LLVPALRLSANGRAFFKLDPIPVASQVGGTASVACANVEQTMQDLSSGVAEVQALIGGRNLDEAERKLNSLVARYSGIAVLYDLLGNIYYIRKDVGRALTAYKKSQQISPGSIETERMIKKLQEIRSPGGQK
jgi:predicted Zn-dependent protease